MRAILLLVLFFFWVSCSNCDDPDTLDVESSSSIESSESYSSSESSSSEESRSSSSDSEMSEKMSENAHPDFIKIIATDKVVKIRDNGTENQNEVSLKVKLSYDYLIGKHEVTCGEYSRRIRTQTDQRTNSFGTGTTPGSFQQLRIRQARNKELLVLRLGAHFPGKRFHLESFG